MSNMGEMIQFSSGDQQFDGYLAVSATGVGPGVIVLQEWWGLVGHIKDVADRFAAEGFTALAPDLYQGKTTAEPDEAATLMQAMSIAETEKILAEAVITLGAHPATTSEERIGIIGFCMGGQLALFAACNNPAIKAAVSFYGIHPKVNPVYRELNGPVLGIFAEHDNYASPAAVKALSEELTLLGKPHTFTTYPGTHHAFFNDQRPEVYDSEASADAWAKTLAFFRTELSDARVSTK
jgi:carboxymethylenebutenolidase